MSRRRLVAFRILTGFLALLLVALVFSSIEFACGRLVHSKWRFFYSGRQPHFSKDISGPPADRRFEVPSSYRRLKKLRNYQPHAFEGGITKTYVAINAKRFCCDVINHSYAPFAAESVATAVLESANRLIFKVRYTVNSHHVRVTPPTAADVKGFALFLGCSFTFGEGLNDDETLPYFYERADKNHRAYNLGFSGYGANNLLARAREPEQKNMITQKRGDIFYIFMDAHMSRTLGSYFFRDPQVERPYFYEKDGQLLQDRDFASHQSILGRIGFRLAQTMTAQFFGIDYPRFSNPEGARSFVRYIRGLRDEYAKSFPDSEFYFVIYPKSALGPLLIPALEAQRIHYLDYSEWDLSLYSESDSYIPGEGHPSASGNRLFATQLAADIAAFKPRWP